MYNNRPVYGFFHICQLNNWEEILDSQLKTIHDSNIMSVTDSLKYVVLGDEDIEIYLPKTEKIFYSKKINLYEYPSLKAIQSLAKNQKAYIWYIHTKGVSRPSNNMSAWREYMMYFIVERYDMCLALIPHYDAVGVDLIKDPLHWSGNFWFSKSEYISTLPDLSRRDCKKDRMYAELWVGEGRGKFKSICQSNKNLYTQQIKREEYASE